MSMQYLGEQFEIHTGGIDHIPVHHTNEIAQSEAATGKTPFVKYWVHHNFLRIENEKMSKSLGNFFTIDDVAARGFSPMALRLLFLGAHYRSELNFTWENLAASQAALERLLKLLVSFKNEKERTTLSSEKLDAVEEFRTRFFAFMEDDLQTPEALAVFWEVTKSNIPGQDKYELIMTFDEVLGLDLAKQTAEFERGKSAQDIPQEIRALADQRQVLRAKGEFAKADALRQQLLDQGWQVVDEGGGYKLIR